MVTRAEIIKALGDIRAIDAVFASAQHRRTIDAARDLLSSDGCVACNGYGRTKTSPVGAPIPAIYGDRECTTCLGDGDPIF